jgi:hypothetical protein
MPIPKPESKEDEKKYIARCMSELKGEYPETKQRIAICLNEWSKK